MQGSQNIDVLKKAVIQQFGRRIEDRASCEQLSIEIFLATGHYISKNTIACFFGIDVSKEPDNLRILNFLEQYSKL